MVREGKKQDGKSFLHIPYNVKMLFIDWRVYVPAGSPLQCKAWMAWNSLEIPYYSSLYHYTTLFQQEQQIKQQNLSRVPERQEIRIFKAYPCP